MTSFWWLILFFIDRFFIFRKSVKCKKYKNANGKVRKYTNAIDIGIIWSCGDGGGGGSGGSAGSFIACIVSMAGSFITYIDSISAFFASFKILSFNLFIYFSLPLHAAWTGFGCLSFVTFSGVLSMFILK